MIIGKFLRTWRAYYKVTQQELADLAGVTRCTIGNWEAGKHHPQKAAWARFEKARQKVERSVPCYSLTGRLGRPQMPFISPVFPPDIDTSVLLQFCSLGVTKRERGECREV